MAFGAKARRLQLRGQPRYLTAFPFHPVAGGTVEAIIAQKRSGFNPYVVEVYIDPSDSADFNQI